MQRLFLIVMVLTVGFFGLQVPTVTAGAPQCKEHQMYSAVESESALVQRDLLCNEYFVDALPTQYVSREYLEQMLSSTQPNFDPDSAFSLHSNPDAGAIIYLDFDGHTWQEGSWWIGAYGISVGETSAGYTLDNDPTTFTEIERNAIHEIWSNVAEEFSMYDVDVTTERPTGVRDVVFQTRGSHALILSEDSVQQGCGCGGVAYVDVFANGNTWNYPALNFSKFGTYFAPPADTAEIISHEVGHNLGLAHDGTTTGIEYYGGHAMWTPIMGAGRGIGIATWSYGGYPNADTRWNQISGDDDFAQIDYYLDFYDDDYSDTLIGAEVLDQSALNGLTRGVISTRDDVDMFRFEVTEANAGLWEIEILPADVAPNLDPELTLYNSSGAVIAVENPLVTQPSSYYTNVIDGLDARMNVELAAGIYYLGIDGVGQGSLSLGTGYDDYASRGSYALRFGLPSSGAFIRRVTPAQGGYGSVVRILGSNLDEVTGVRVGSKVIDEFTLLSNNEIMFGVPSGASSAPLIVETAAGNLTATQNFTVINANVYPTIASVSSMTGVVDQVITMVGDNLGATTRLTLAGQNIDFRITSSRSIEFQVTPTMISGQLSLFTAGGSDSARGTFTVLIPMLLNSFSPSSGSVGTTITLSGSRFTSDTKVIFYGGSLGVRPKISSNQITVRVPAGALTGPITLSNSISSVTSIDNFTMLVPAPTISRFSPTSARIGNTVTVTGTNFVNVQSVRLGTQSVAYTVISASTLRFIVPIGARNGAITVVTLSGTATSRNQLRIR